MAAAGFTPISLYYTTTSGAGGIPSAGNLVNGELAINITDGKLYYKDNGGTVQVIATKATGTIGGSTTQVQYNNAGVLAGSSNLTFDGTSLTLGGNPTLSAGTANGVLYLNGSKVATSGSALTFDGTNAGIGTSSPATILAASLSSSSTGLAIAGVVPTLALYDSSGTTGTGFIGQLNTDTYLFNKESGGLIFGVNASEQMRLTSTGLGIGTSSPGAKLDVAGVVRSEYWIGRSNTSAPTADAFIYRPSDNTLGFGTANTLQLTLDSSGNLGIGTSSPNGKLDVASGNVFITQDYELNWHTGGTKRSQIIGDSINNLKFSNRVGGVLTETMRLDSSGNLGLGGSAARATTAGSAIFNIFNGTAPVGTLTNGISLYSSSGEAYVMDAAGNATLFSPHDRDTNEWIFRSKHTPSGKVLKIDVERLLRFVNDHFGLDAVQEFIEP